MIINELNTSCDLVFKIKIQQIMDKVERVIRFIIKLENAKTY